MDENGNSVGEAEINKEKFATVKLALLGQVVNIYEGNKRQGSASSKNRGEVAGGGRKPWAQKHLGRARAGSIRSPLWRGGGVVFGPKPRDYSAKITKRSKIIALNSAITSKFDNDEVVITENFKFEKPNTKKMSTILKNLGIDCSCLIIIAKRDESVWKSARNISTVMVKSVADLNAYDVIKQERLVITQNALDLLNKE